jgi:hypothetical protein
MKALNLVGKIGLPSSFGEIREIWRENVGMLRLCTIKARQKNVCFPEALVGGLGE